MKRSELPNKNEWDKIVKEAFSSSENHSFSTDYKQKKETILRKGIIMKNNRYLPERVFTGVVAAAVAVVVAIPTGIVIKNSKDHGRPDDVSDSYVAAPSKTEPAVESQTKDPVADMEIKKQILFNYIPEGFLKKSDEKSDSVYTSLGNIGGFRCDLYKVGNDVNLYDYRIMFTAREEDFHLNDRHVTITFSDSYQQGDSYNYNRMAWVKYDDLPIAAKIIFSDDISDKDMETIIENMEIVDADEDRLMLLTDLDKTEQLEADFNSVNEPNIGSYPDINDINISHIGDMVYSMQTIAQNKTMNVDIRVIDAFLTESINSINTDSIGLDADYSAFADVYGNLLDFAENRYRHIKQSNGFYRAEVDKTVTEDAKILVANIAYTNTSDVLPEGSESYCVNPELMTVIDNKVVPLSALNCTRTRSNLDEISSERESAFSFSVDGNYKGSKNDIILNPGETVIVHLAFLVRESETENLFLKVESFNETSSSSDWDSYKYIELNNISIQGSESQGNGSESQGDGIIN